MNKEEFTKIMTYLGVAYDKKFTGEELTIWYSFFNEIESDVFKVAIKNIIEKSRFMPTISDLKSEINRIKNPELKLFAEDEWLEVLNAIRKYGSYQEDKALNSLKSYTREIIERIGYQNICLSENINWERKVFIETFNSCMKNQEHNIIEKNNERILQNKKINNLLTKSTETS